MEEGRGVYRGLVGKPKRRRQLGRPRLRWDDNIRMDLREVGCGCVDWMELAQDKDRCNTCKEVYVGQSGRPITTRYKEHIYYIRHNNPTSAYAMHILNNRHESGPVEQILILLKPCTKGTRMNCWEALYMHLHHKRSTLISEQQVNDTNPLFDLANIPRDLQHIP
jgi:hypothetical protein